METPSSAPAGARWLVEGWHRIECLIAVAAFGFIAGVLVLDVAGRELLGPLYKLFGIKGATGVYASQKMSVYALVTASFIAVSSGTLGLAPGGVNARIERSSPMMSPAVVLVAEDPRALAEPRAAPLLVGPDSRAVDKSPSRISLRRGRHRPPTGDAVGGPDTPRAQRP